jgi:hypothetical protein
MTRQFVKFVLRFAVLYALVVSPWPGWRKSYGDYFRALGNLVYEHHGVTWSAQMEPCLRTKGFAAMDSQIVLYHKNRDGNIRPSFLGIDSRSIGWLPTGLALSLVLVLPLPLHRRMIALALAFLAVQAYILMVIGIYLLNRAPEAGIFNVPGWVAFSCGALEWTFVTQMGPGFVVPVLIAFGAVLIAAGRFLPTSQDIGPAN